MLKKEWGFALNKDQDKLSLIRRFGSITGRMTPPKSVAAVLS
jgi:hypothetical protein